MANRICDLKNARSCKLGTMPALVWLHGADAKHLAPGRWVRVREMIGGKWSRVLVNRVDSDGYFQADR